MGMKGMTEELLTKKELGAFFKLNPDSARALCEKHGIYPLNVGAGKIARLRWRVSDVMQILTILQAGSEAKKKAFRTRRPGDARIAGLSVKEVMKAVANSVVQ